MTEPEGVRPFDWLNALRGAPVLASNPVAPTLTALLMFAPGRPRPRGCRRHHPAPVSVCLACRSHELAFWVSHDQLAEAVLSSESTMKRGTAALRKSGHLVLLRRGSGGYVNRANEYRLAVPASPAKVAAEDSS